MTAPTTPTPSLPPSPRSQRLRVLQGRADVLAARLDVVKASLHDLGTALDADPHPALRV